MSFKNCSLLYVIFFICSINAFGNFFKLNIEISNNEQPVFVYKKWHRSLLGQTCSLSRYQVEMMPYKIKCLGFLVNSIGFAWLKYTDLSSSGVIKGFACLVGFNALLAYDYCMFQKQAAPWLKALQEKEALLKAS